MNWEKLKASGLRLLERAQKEMDKERVTNTYRRARLAGYAVEAAAKEMKIARICIDMAVFAMENPKRYEFSDSFGKRVSHAPYEYLGSVGSLKGLRLLLGRLEVSRGTRERETLVHVRGKELGLEDIEYASLPKVYGNEDVGVLLKPYLKMGICSDEVLRGALRELLPFVNGVKVVIDPVKEFERSLVGKQLGVDFFPTPVHLADEMVFDAGICDGSRVLEPSAGSGNLADAVVRAGGVVDCVEWSSTLSDFLKLKGHSVLGSDFMEFDTTVLYDSVIMNPPFSNRMDALHVMKAWDFLRDGGTLVAIVGEGLFFGSDAKAVEFRSWLSDKRGQVTVLPAGTFMDKSLLANTGANARKVVLHK